MQQHSWPQAEPSFPRTLDCWALEGPLVLLGDFQAPSEKDTIKKELDWVCDLSTWHADPLIRKSALACDVASFWKICLYKTEQSPGLGKYASS